MYKYLNSHGNINFQTFEKVLKEAGAKKLGIEISDMFFKRSFILKSLGFDVKLSWYFQNCTAKILIDINEGNILLPRFNRLKVSKMFPNNSERNLILYFEKRIVAVIPIFEKVLKEAGKEV